MTGDYRMTSSQHVVTFQGADRCIKCKENKNSSCTFSFDIEIEGSPRSIMCDRCRSYRESRFRNFCPDLSDLKERLPAGLHDRIEVERKRRRIASSRRRAAMSLAITQSERISDNPRVPSSVVPSRALRNNSPKYREGANATTVNLASRLKPASGATLPEAVTLQEPGPSLGEEIDQSAAIVNLPTIQNSIALQMTSTASTSSSHHCQQILLRKHDQLAIRHYIERIILESDGQDDSHSISSAHQLQEFLQSIGII